MSELRCQTINCGQAATEVGPDGSMRCGDCGDYLYRRLPDRPSLRSRLRAALVRAELLRPER